MKKNNTYLIILALFSIIFTAQVTGQNAKAKRVRKQKELTNTIWTEPVDSMEAAEVEYQDWLKTQSTVSTKSTLSVSSLSVTTMAVSSPDSYNYYVSKDGSDSNTGTEASPFATIQKAINTASTGMTIKVMPGTYYENLNFNGKSIQLLGSPDNPELTVIDANGTGRAITMTNRESTSTLVSGFVLTGGNASNASVQAGHGGAVYLYNNARPKLTHLIIKGNTARVGGAISARHNGDPTLENCLIYGNTAYSVAVMYIYNASEVYMYNVTIGDNVADVSANGNIYLQRGARLESVNSILWSPDQDYEICFSSSTTYNSACTAVMNYTDLRGGQSGNVNFGTSGYSMTVTWGTGSINSNPLFKDADNGDFILLSSSPCIDAGNPSSDYYDVNFPPSQGTTTNDMGVYGGPSTWKTNIGIDDYSGYWPFNGNANDISGNNNHGTPTLGTDFAKDRFNNENSSFEFTEIGQQINLQQPVDVLSLNDFTFSAWVRIPYGSITENRLFSDGLLVIKPTGYFNIETGDNSSMAMGFGKWQHIAMTLDNTSRQVSYYLNGQPAGKSYVSNTEIVIDHFGEGFIGKIDDIRFYHGALRDADILSVYEEEAPVIFPIENSRVTYIPGSGVAIAWDALTGEVEQIIIRRSSETTGDTEIASLSAENTSFVDNNPISGETNTYVITSNNSAYSVSSDPLEIRVPDAPVSFDIHNCIGYWPFNGNAIDESGNGNDGNLSSYSFSKDRFNIADQSYEFQNYNEQIILSQPIDITSHDGFVVSSWIRITEGSVSDYRLLSDGILVINSLGYFSMDGNEASNVPIEFNKWQHIAMSIDRPHNEINYYLNGLHVGKTSFSDLSATKEIRNFGDDSFSGKIDNIRLYDNLLSASNIAYLYEQEAPSIFPVENINLTFNKETGVAITWDAVKGNVEGITVKREDKSNNWPDIATLSPSATSFVDVGYEPGEINAYIIHAHNQEYGVSSDPMEIKVPESTEVQETLINWIEQIGVEMQDGVYSKNISGLGYGILRTSNVVSGTGFIEFEINNTDNTSAIVISGPKSPNSTNFYGAHSFVLENNLFYLYNENTQENLPVADNSFEIGDIFRLEYTIDDKNLIIYKNYIEVVRWHASVSEYPEGSYINVMIKNTGNANFSNLRTSFNWLDDKITWDKLNKTEFINNGNHIQPVNGTLEGWADVAALATNNILLPNQNGYIAFPSLDGMYYALGLMDADNQSFNYTDINYAYVVDKYSGKLYARINGKQILLEEGEITNQQLMLIRKDNHIYFIGGNKVLHKVTTDPGLRLIPHLNIHRGQVGITNHKTTMKTEEQYDVEWKTLVNLTEDGASLSGSAGTTGEAIPINEPEAYRSWYYSFSVGSCKGEVKVGNITFYADGTYQSNENPGVQGAYSAEDVFKVEYNYEAKSTAISKNNMIFDRGNGQMGLHITSSGAFTLNNIKTGYPTHNIYSTDQTPMWTKYKGVKIEEFFVRKMVADGWGNAVVSSEKYYPANEDFNLNIPIVNGFNQDAIIGVSKAVKDQHTAPIQYGIYLENGNLHIYENGTDLGIFCSYTEDDSEFNVPIRLRINRLRNKINYWYEGKRLRQVTVDPDTKMVIDVSIYKQNAVVGYLKGNYTYDGTPPRYYPVYWNNVAGATTNGGATLTKTESDGWGNAGAFSRNKFIPGWDDRLKVELSEYNNQNLNSFIGLSYEDTDVDRNSIDYAFYLNGGTVYIYEKGTQIGSYETYSQYDAFQIMREGSEIVYIQNGIELYRSATDKSKYLNVDVAMNLKGSFINVSCTKEILRYINSAMTAPLVYTPAPDDNYNYIHTIAPRTPMSDIGFTTSRSNEDVDETIQYYDGLGRHIQSVDLVASPGQKDIAQPVVYDELGRQSLRYLPYTDGANGSYKSDALTVQKEFYKSRYLGTSAVSETVFDNSPLNRVIEQGAPGGAWQVIKDDNGISTGDGNTVKIAYLTNDGTQKLWIAENTLTGITSTTTYSANELYVVETTDENGSVTREFKNKQGQVVLKESDISSATNGVYQTYYVYDDLGLLRCVIPPKATEVYLSSGTLETELCYYYKYDNKQRMIIKKLPGSGEVHMVYDNRDRLVASQDGNMRAHLNSSDEPEPQWLFTKYDALNRPVMTGIMISDADYSTLQTTVNSSTGDNLYEEHGTDLEGYTNRSFPTQTGVTGSVQAISKADLLTVNYYDNYDYRPSGYNYTVPNTDNLSGFAATDFETNYSSAYGLPTVSLVKNLETDDWMPTVTYYDGYERVMQVVQKNPFPSASDINRVSTLYNFTGQVTGTVSENIVNGSNKIIAERMVYDYSGRLVEQYHQFAGDPEVLMTKLVFNELGQVERDFSHGTLNAAGKTEFVQRDDYRYNIRGWLTGTNINLITNGHNDQFSQRLYYESPIYFTEERVKPQFNGNISAITWLNRRDEQTKCYGFEYDELNRLTVAQFGKPGTSYRWQKLNKYSVPLIQYDANGNIRKLQRYDGNGTLIDDMTYYYKNNENSNRLASVYDASLSAAGFSDQNADKATDYSYDANGNMSGDANKGLSDIKYNYLNLPQQFTKNGSNVTYTYDAAGRKLKFTNSGGDVKTYSGLLVYNDDGSYYIITPKGRLVVGKDGAKSYEYNVTDHLGNTRLVYSDLDGDFFVDKDEIIQVADYYPFGMRHEVIELSSDNKYLYNGKELQDDSEWLDYGMRMYDAALARFHTVDPWAEKYEYQSPYVYAHNNPILFIDWMGLGDPVVRNGVYFVSVPNFSLSFVQKQPMNSFTGTVRGSYQSSKTDYTVNLQQYQKQSNASYLNLWPTLGASPSFQTMGQNVENGNTTGLPTDNTRSYIAQNSNGKLVAGLGNVPEGSSFGFGGGIPIVINGQKYGENTEGDVLSSKGYANQNSTSVGKVIIGFNSETNGMILVVSPDELQTGGMTLDEIRDYLISEGYDNVMGFDGGSSSTLIQDNNTLVDPAWYKDNTIPTGLQVTEQ